jgi:spore coat polysaccharide biosynthesis predicted glycosyltransferase SpsG
LRGGYFTFKTDYLNPFPIKRIDFNNKAEKIMHDNIVKLVSEIITERNNKKTTAILENKIDALVFRLYGLTENEILQVLETFKDLSIKDRNQIQNEYWNITNNKFQLEA